jgi:hypothetical protein
MNARRQIFLERPLARIRMINDASLAILPLR